MFPEVLAALLDRVPDLGPEAVDGWRAAALPGRLYPVLVPGAGRVHGRLLTGLGAADWRILDAYEDDLYDLVRLPLAGGGHAWTYVSPGDGGESEADWSADEFGTRHLDAYVRACADWRTGYETSLADGDGPH
ncbi:gamma-glutamylcyclotransferase family protein [Yinghuangia soli]|uniref:Putative gamma-glutamylcyclotransferase n=1 Tax=Yinghuangia soli TaxID=2908204 RepID=A0AA41U3K2_9ACTN|nr:gamma-glutamylcyclotransferase family protein [Yinghuangia soli]MCF2531901.1 gamma-glutamylcyclotransferase [Yinghuangia soli]